MLFTFMVTSFADNENISSTETTASTVTTTLSITEETTEPIDLNKMPEKNHQEIIQVKAPNLDRRWRQNAPPFQAPMLIPHPIVYHSHFNVPIYQNLAGERSIPQAPRIVECAQQGMLLLI